MTPAERDRRKARAQAARAARHAAETAREVSIPPGPSAPPCNVSGCLNHARGRFIRRCVSHWPKVIG